jgi:hypothetical protein
MFHNFMKIYNVVKNMSPETRKLWIEAFQRVVDVEAEAENALEKDRLAMKGPVKPSEQEQNLDYALEIVERMKHTPKGGSRKRSINCRRPRGFSQRQHCKYGRRRGWASATRRKSKSARY